MTVLLYVLAVYVAVCWVWGVYMAVRLYSGRRISRLVRGRGIRPRLTRATHQDTSGVTRPKGAPQIASATLAKAEAAAAKSRAA
jgi:hypothetical protein